MVQGWVCILRFFKLKQGWQKKGKLHKNGIGYEERVKLTCGSCDRKLVRWCDRTLVRSKNWTGFTNAQSHERTGFTDFR